ncbi:hypothetical protein CGLO_00313 [Colletotrichum gloeosporioides Cg-14]|nr:hypothetical protein CGLO_00313 [Colletotrichum gloeosporioides Cg-14]
MSTLPLH